MDGCIYLWRVIYLLLSMVYHSTIGTINSGEIIMPDFTVDPKEEFSVGDSVRLVTSSPRAGIGMVRKGDIGLVRAVDNTNTRVLVDFPDHERWAGFTDEIEKLKTYPVG